MNQIVRKVMLFTLSACPLGRSMNSVLGEVRRCVEGLEFQIVHVDVDTDVTNHYRIKTNPTTLFLDLHDNELYRFEGLKETEVTLRIMEQINEESLRIHAAREENQENEETYVIYLVQNETVVPLETSYLNKTSVKAPRITAIKQLLQTRIKGYINPFPSSTSLELVHFEHEHAEIVLRVDRSENHLDKDRMKELLKKTLSHFGVVDVELILLTR
ncbi:hypothetical protein M5X11_21900 [Paenibacillus alginolyticus]|uniref:hypothetical protein n=1 Tax=Paenibacillus alginolyticus TaxID=59839 RepID=UPI0004074E3E|nr:hypothetical protein [Paenibacillus alginolyticus]MCY9667537.1 hypothetical protein [Paenibacillus alginolyticus]